MDRGACLVGCSPWGCKELGTTERLTLIYTYSAYKLNKRGDNIQPWHNPSPIWNRLLFHVQFSMLLLELHTDFSGGTSDGLVFPSLKNFPQIVVIHTVKGFGIVNKTEAHVFLELSCFLDNSVDVGNLICGSSAFSESSLNIWKFSVHLLVKRGLKNFEHYFASMLDECNCAVVWAFFGIAFLWDWNENRPFPVLWPLLSFPNLLAYWVSTFIASSFRILNSSTGILSLPLSFFIVMLPKAHLNSHSRISGSRWVITPSWLSGSWRSFWYSYSVYSCHLFLISSASVRSIQFLSFIVPIFAWNIPLVSLVHPKGDQS